MNRRNKAPARKLPVAVKPPRGRRPQSLDLRAAKDALYRDHIMEAAERIFAEQGYASAKMQDIASAVGISLATLYQAFSGKTELHRAIRVARDTEMFNAVVQRQQQSFTATQVIEKLLWLMETHLRYFLEYPNYLRMQLQQGHAWYHSTAWPSEDERVLWERGMNLMKQMFLWGQGEGYLVPGEPEDLARLLMAVQQTRLANWVAAGMKEDHGAVIARIQADFVRTFCRPSKAAALLSADGSSLLTRAV